MGRIAPLTLEEMSEEIRPYAEAHAKRMGFAANSFRTLARKPKIAKAFADLQQAIAQSITFDPTLRSMMFHIMSHASGCQYCQAHSISGLAKSTKIPEEKLAAIWEFETSPLFTDAERAALRLAQASAIVPNAATDEHFDELRKYFSEEQIVEMVAALCVGAWLNRWNDTMASTLEDEPLEAAERLIGPKGWAVGKHK